MGLSPPWSVRSTSSDTRVIASRFAMMRIVDFEARGQRGAQQVAWVRSIMIAAHRAMNAERPLYAVVLTARDDGSMERIGHYAFDRARSLCDHALCGRYVVRHRTKTASTPLSVVNYVGGPKRPSWRLTGLRCGVGCAGSYPSEQQANDGELDECLARLHLALIVLPQPSIPDQPPLRGWMLKPWFQCTSSASLPPERSR